jgi:hypothetical protein
MPETTGKKFNPCPSDAASPPNSPTALPVVPSITENSSRKVTARRSSASRTATPPPIRPHIRLTSYRRTSQPQISANP